jgi:preprotein translocase SecE subunit
MAALNPLKFLQEVRQEVGKVTWPTRNETLVSTVMVLVLVVAASLLLPGGRPSLFPGSLQLDAVDPRVSGKLEL